MNTQDWSPLGRPGWISSQSKGLSRVFSNTTVQNWASILRHSAFFIVQLSHPYVTTGKTITLTRLTFVGKVTPLFLICCLGCPCSAKNLTLCMPGFSCRTKELLLGSICFLLLLPFYVWHWKLWSTIQILGMEIVSLLTWELWNEHIVWFLLSKNLQSQDKNYH